MQVTERRKRILDFIYKNGPLSYEEILEKTSSFSDSIDILSDLDILVFFRFLQNVEAQRSLMPETVLELRPKTKDQIKNDPSRIDTRLKELANEIPPWYRKRAVLTVLNRRINEDEILESVKRQYHHVTWSPLLVKASLEILLDGRYISQKEQYGEVTYKRANRGESLLKEPLMKQFFLLRKLKNEFTYEFRVLEILKLIISHKGISSGKIVHYFQTKYGIRGKKRRAITNTLKKMVFSGLLRIVGGNEFRRGHVYYLGETIESLFSGEAEIMYHDVQDFKETVKQFFEKYKHTRDAQLPIEKALYGLDLCKEDLSQMPPECWVDHIGALLSIKYQGKESAWENRMLKFIVACILSRLLPSGIAVKILNDFLVPSSSSRGEYVYFSGVVREYNFNLTKAYLDLGDHEKAFQHFDYVSLLTWESFEFLILKGTVEMRKGNMREALDIFRKSSEISSGRERIVALFHMGLAHFLRGDFEEAEKQWNQCLNSGCTINEQIILRHNLGNTYRISGRLNKARKFYESSIALAEALEKEKFKFWSCIGLVNTLIDLGLWNEAEKKLREIIQKCTEKEFSLVLAFAMTSQGIIFGRRERHEEAFECHKKALELVDRKSNPQEYIMILINMGKALQQLGRIEEALAKLEEAHELISNDNMTLLRAVEINLADLYIDVGRFHESWELSQSILWERWLDNRRVEAEAWRIQGKIFFRKNKFEEAKEQLTKSERVLRECNLNYELIGVIQLLEECCRALGDEMQVAYYGNLRKNLAQKINFQNSFFS